LEERERRNGRKLCGLVGGKNEEKEEKGDGGFHIYFPLKNANKKCECLLCN